MNRSSRSTASLAFAAFGSLAVFPLIVVVLHVVQTHRYNPLRQAISELALGRSGWLMMIAFCSSGLGTLLLALTLRRGATHPGAAPALLTVAGLLSFVSAFVHADAATVTTTHGQIHKLAGLATFILIIAAMFVLGRTFRRDPSYGPLAAPTRIWALLALGTFFLIPFSRGAYFGLAQRISIATSITWVLTTSLYAYLVERHADTWRPSARTETSSDNPTAPRAGSPELSTT